MISRKKTVPSGYLGKDLKLFGHLPLQSNLPKSLCIKQRENKKEYFQSPLTGKENSYGGGKQANTGPGRRPAPQLKGRLEDETANDRLLMLLSILDSCFAAQICKGLFKVQDASGNTTQFKIKTATALKKLMSTYCERNGLDVQVSIFVFGNYCGKAQE